MVQTPHHGGGFPGVLQDNLDDDRRNLVQPVSGRECLPHLARCLPRRRSVQEGNTGRIEYRLFGF
jgi:hypothetical protein